MGHRSLAVAFVFLAQAALAAAQAPLGVAQPVWAGSAPLSPPAGADPGPSVYSAPPPGAWAPQPQPESPAAPAPQLQSHAHPEGAYCEPAVSCSCWVVPEYLLWWVKPSRVAAPLVSTGNLGDPNTAVLFGNSNVEYSAFSGGRLTAGTWFDPYGVIGLEGAGFALAQRTVNSTFASDATGRPGLALPFFNVLANLEDSADVSIPDLLTGRVVASSTLSLWGAEGNLVFNLYRGSQAGLEVLGGFRYLRLQEDLFLTRTGSPLPGQQITFDDATFNSPALVTTQDRFRTYNSFYGGQLGLRARFGWGGLFAELVGKLGLGDTNELVRISGSTSLQTSPGATPQTLAGGVYALPSNSGRFSADEFTAVTEGEVKLGYQFSRHVTAFVGYNALYWSRVARPGEQIDRNVNITQIPSFQEFRPGTAVGPPSTTLNSTDFWVQGLSFGVELFF